LWSANHLLASKRPTCHASVVFALCGFENIERRFGMGMLSRLFGKENRAGISKKQNEVSVDITNEIQLGEATKILRFLSENTDKYNNHVLFLKELINQNLYPDLKVICLKSANTLASYEYLIVITGSKKEYLRQSDKGSVFDNVAFETFKKVHPGKEPKVMWANGTVKNTPGEGETIQTLDYFNETLNEIDNNYYVIQEVLSKEGQYNKLDEMETEMSAELEKIKNRIVTCVECEAEFKLRQIPDLKVENGFAFYDCPECKFNNLSKL